MCMALRGYSRRILTLSGGHGPFAAALRLGFERHGRKRCRRFLGPTIATWSDHPQPRVR